MKVLYPLLEDINYVGVAEKGKESIDIGIVMYAKT